MPPKNNITLENIQELLEKQKKDIISEIKSDLNEKIKLLEERVGESDKFISNNKNNIAELSERIAVMELAMKDQKNIIDNQMKQIEDQTNRSLRNTLILRNLPEETTEKSWDQTKRNLCDHLGYYLNMDTRHVANMIERCHRSTHSKENRVRPIYIRFFDWNDAQFVLNTISKLKSKDKNITFKIDQMYTNSVMERRNLALKARKELIQDPENSIIQGYLAYPAKLMVKEENGTKFTFYKAY